MNLITSSSGRRSGCVSRIQWPLLINSRGRAHAHTHARTRTRTHSHSLLALALAVRVVSPLAFLLPYTHTRTPTHRRHTKKKSSLSLLFISLLRFCGIKITLNTLNMSCSDLGQQPTIANHLAHIGLMLLESRLLSLCCRVEDGRLSMSVSVPTTGVGAHRTTRLSGVPSFSTK